MKFDKEIYPDEMKETLEDAVMNSARNYVEGEIREREMECSECGCTDLEAEIKSEEGSDYSQKAICSECGTEEHIKVDISDLNSSNIF